MFVSLDMTGHILIGVASAVLGCSPCTTRRLLDRLGEVTRDSSGRRVITPEMLAQLVSLRAARVNSSARRRADEPAAP